MAVMWPMEIEAENLRIIESELPISLNPEIKSITMQAIHATADLSYAVDLKFTPGVVPLIQDMIKRRATIITDTEMAKSGINKRAAEKAEALLRCFMSNPSVEVEARKRRVARALISMEHALELPGPKLFVCGNAPTFLLRLIEEAPLSDVAVIGLPVGFVNVVESKRLLLSSGLPCIANTSRCGGSAVAAAVVNALLYSVVGR